MTNTAVSQGGQTDRESLPLVGLCLHRSDEIALESLHQTSYPSQRRSLAHVVYHNQTTHSRHNHEQHPPPAKVLLSGPGLPVVLAPALAVNRARLTGTEEPLPRPHTELWTMHDAAHASADCLLSHVRERLTPAHTRCVHIATLHALYKPV